MTVGLVESGGGGEAVTAVTDDWIMIRIPRPPSVGESRSDAAKKLVFAAHAESCGGFIRWHRYRAVYDLLVERIADAERSAEQGETSAVFGRVYDPVCQVAASYAAPAGVRQLTAEWFAEEAQACFERIPAVGRLMRDGVITPAWFRRVVEQVALVTDPEMLAFLDAEITHRLQTMGALSAKRVEHAVAAIVAEHDPDAATDTREQIRAWKKLMINPLTDSMSEMVVTASKEDAILCKDSIDAVIAGVCNNDPRTRNELRSDAAVARLAGVRFECRCRRDDCQAELSDEAIASRCAKVVLHVVARQETLDGESSVPAVMDGHGPISAHHVRDLAGRPDAICRPLDLGDLVGGQSQPGNSYRPKAALDTAVRGLFGTCSWVGCDRPAWRCDLDHVTEYNHADPAAGGPTCACNLNPKCKFHHGLKTHADGWLDDQIIDADGVIWTEVTTPEGITVRQQATNTWLLPELGLLPCTHPPITPEATRPGIGHAEDAPKRTRTRLEAKHRYRLQQRATNRRRREARNAAPETVEDTYGEPPF